MEEYFSLFTPHLHHPAAACRRSGTWLEMLPKKNKEKSRVEKIQKPKQSHIGPNKRSSQWHIPVCRFHCRCNDSWENSSRDELAGYKSPLLQDISTRPNPASFLPLFVAELYECLCARGARGRACSCVCRCLCARAYWNVEDHHLNPYHGIWFHYGLAHWFVTEQWAIFKTWTDRALFPLSASHPLSTCLPRTTSSICAIRAQRG